MEILEQRVNALERLVADLNGQFDERIRKIVNEEIQRRWQGVLKATYPPELWQALQSKFPDILSDSHE